MKKLVIFGGSGTFGTSFTEKLLKDTDWNITCVSRNETKGFDWLQKFDNDKRISYVVGDIRDYDTCFNVLQNADYCIIAAAIKHIDYAEKFPMECTRTNVKGVINCINAAIAQKVKKCIYMSTDKATNPTTIYGCSKFYCELYAKAVNNEDTELIRTRYGNVWASNGSVAWIFSKLANEGKPLTVTNPEMTRFFMTVDQAVEVVWNALTNGTHGDLWCWNNKSASIKQVADCFSKDQIVVGNRVIEKTDEALLTVNELNHSNLIKVDGGELFRVNDNLISPIKYTQPLTSDTAERFTEQELHQMVDNWKNSLK